MPVLAGQSIVAAILDQSTYTPVLTATTTNPTLGVASIQAGWWKRIDNLITGGAIITFGTSGTAAGSGNYLISLPFAADAAFMTAAGGLGNGSVVGVGLARDNSAVTAGSRGFWCWLNTTTTILLGLANGTNQVVTDAAPFVFAASDSLSIDFAYQADPTAF